MLKIQGNVLASKGMLAPKARDLIANRILNDFDATGWERVPDQKAWQMQFIDSEGHVVYAVLDLRITTANPEEKEKKSSKHENTIDWCQQKIDFS